MTPGYNCAASLNPYKRGDEMRARSISLCAAVCLAGALMGYASSEMGTWKLNEGKSKFPAGARKNTTVTYSAAGDQTKVTTDGTEADGKPVHTEWTGKFDGKDYPLTGDPLADARAYKRVNAHTLELVSKKDGKVVSTGRVAMSPDGKTRTVTVTMHNAAGKTLSYTAEYDKE
jgi:hypothetical protein